MRPDVSMFNEHVLEAAFQGGKDKGMWGIVSDDPVRPSWPYVIIWIAAAIKINGPEKYYFRFDLNAYPNMAPTACPWDIGSNSKLPNEKWPRGKKFVSKTFNPAWKDTAIYAPCDRIAMVGHDVWRQGFPELWWQPSFKICVYLNFIHHLLNSSDYATS